MPLIESQKSELEREIELIIQDANLEEREILQNSPIKKKSFLRTATDLFFEPKPWERWQNGRMYELLGINIFRKYLLGPWVRFTRWRNPNKQKTDTYFIGDRKSLENIKSYINKARINEVVHSSGAIIMLHSFLDQLHKGFSEGDCFWTITSSAAYLFNAYLSLNQRYIRARCYDVIEHREAKKNAS